MTLSSDYAFTVYDTTGALYAGAPVTWLGGSPVDVATGLPTSAPTVTDKGSGLYTVSRLLSGIHVAGIMDFGVLANPQFRWQVYDSPTSQNNDFVFAERSSDFSPLAGLAAASSWASGPIDQVTGLYVAVPAPFVRELGSGLYACPSVATVSQHVIGVLDFGVTAQSRYLEYDSVGSGLAFTVTALVDGVLEVGFPFSVVQSVDILKAANYTIGSPPGSPALTSTLASFTSANSVSLAYSGEMTNGANYTLTIASGTAKSVLDGTGNTGSPVAFTGVASRPTATVVTSVGNQLVLVQFSKSVRMVSSSNTDDALHAANYSIPGLTVSSVSPVSSTRVNLNTTVQSVISYTLTLSNIKDLAGNLVVP